ncbi:MAG: recombination protein RecO, partial [Campylobacter sp.]|nr:recombination protein RecO [Campylobacter sp.]
MQGYILQTKPVRDEDLLVWILTPARLVCCYRFYGARHGAISQG